MKRFFKVLGTVILGLLMVVTLVAGPLYGLNIKGIAVGAWVFEKIHLSIVFVKMAEWLHSEILFPALMAMVFGISITAFSLILHNYDKTRRANKKAKEATTVVVNDNGIKKPIPPAQPSKPVNNRKNSGQNKGGRIQF